MLWMMESEMLFSLIGTRELLWKLILKPDQYLKQQIIYLRVHDRMMLSCPNIEVFSANEEIVKGY